MLSKQHTLFLQVLHCPIPLRHCSLDAHAHNKPVQCLSDGYEDHSVVRRQNFGRTIYENVRNKGLTLVEIGPFVPVLMPIAFERVRRQAQIFLRDDTTPMPPRFDAESYHKAISIFQIE